MKEQTDLLKSAKRYLKSDYKVMSRYLGFEIVLAQFWHNLPLRVQLFLYGVFLKKVQPAQLTFYVCFGAMSFSYMAEQEHTDHFKHPRCCYVALKMIACTETYTCAARREEQNPVMTNLVPRSRARFRPVEATRPPALG